MMIYWNCGYHPILVELVENEKVDNFADHMTKTIPNPSINNIFTKNIKISNKDTLSIKKFLKPGELVGIQYLQKQIQKR